MILAKDLYLEESLFSFSTCSKGIAVFLETCTSTTSRQVLNTNISTKSIRISIQDVKVTLKKDQTFNFREIDNILWAIAKNLTIEESERHKILSKAFEITKPEDDNMLFATFQGKPSVVLSTQNETLCLNFLSILPENLSNTFIDAFPDECEIYYDDRLWRLCSSTQPIKETISFLTENLIEFKFLDKTKKTYITNEFIGIALKSMLNQEAYRLKSMIEEQIKPVTNNYEPTIKLLNSIENLFKNSQHIAYEKNTLNKVASLQKEIIKMPNIIKRGIINLQKHFC